MMSDLAGDLVKMPRSELLTLGIDCFKTMLTDPLYTVDDLHIHQKVGGVINANFGGALVRHIEGPGYHCTPETMFDNWWAPLVCQLNHLRLGQLRATFIRQRVDDKLYAKFFKSDYFPIDWSLETTDPILLDQLTDLVQHIKKAGL